MKIRLVIGALCVIVGSVIYSRYFSGKDEKLVQTITHNTAKKLEKHGLLLVGTGARMMDEIEMLEMSFDYPKSADIKTARTLLIMSVEEYLTEINENEKIKPYLKNVPFTASNIGVVIGFPHNEGQIDLAAARDGRLVYYVEENQTLKAILEERLQGISD